MPAAVIDDYRNAPGWKDFQNIVAIDDEVIVGDVDGDGEITIADVNFLINAILNDLNDTQYDMNGDNEVGIADVNILINIVLNN